MTVPVWVMGIVLDLPRHQLLQQPINLCVMYGCGQLHSRADSLRSAADLYSLLKRKLYFFFCLQPIACKSSLHYDFSGIDPAMINRSASIQGRTVVQGACDEDQLHGMAECTKSM